ncbi:preprotein translocase subunit YajC [Novosphingobium piscinae]|uniref:Preprotein translocase subunit YajC n=2 Tax=Novosphingobium piscinae TaxID=1507448 RepID=A0A7X1FZ09_9SPHN|nr:preprotein translocase subunit YajC [Novosphingobium piscinae]
MAGQALPAQAQSLPYGNTASGDDTVAAPGGGSGQAPRGRGTGPRRQVTVSPYIEAAQVVGAQLSPDQEVLTWTALAAGVDAGLAGRNTQGSLSIRYERRIGWGRAGSGDVLSGLARASVAVVPQALAIEVGGLAARSTVDGRSPAVPGGFTGADSAQLYSVYAGPSLRTQAGAVALTGSYRVGYTEVGTSDTLRTATSTANLDTFDHSITHNAAVRAGVRPGDVLPIGVGVGAGYLREDVSNLDQRVEDFHARSDVIVPVSSAVALVGGVGFEDVQISGRDALRDASGAPVRGPDGRLVTDRAAPRQIAYQTKGFIWDAGITWRPSSRTAFEAHVGRRYGSMTYYGSFGWRASSRSSLSVAVYDSMTGLGGQINRALVELPTEFTALRDPTTGNLNGCVSPTGNPTLAPSGSNCLTSAFGSLRSAVFRSRGVQATYATQLGRLGAGLAGGYDRRRYVAAPGTLLASINGIVDENTWLSAWLSGRLDERSSFSTFVYANWFSNGALSGGQGTALGANALFSREFGNRISGNASFGIQGLRRDLTEDEWQASALLGLRYSFF